MINKIAVQAIAAPPTNNVQAASNTNSFRYMYRLTTIKAKLNIINKIAKSATVMLIIF